ncbi:hypothetical protein DPMN_003725 [Dreissena polymorpha]|uniref:Uncharacterized protein n=1 Tax=Dreissena polymorpha TaxID=45954 RepID=A0A9D4MNU8_DREPO|nr:hypothetical protein DPMN_003725 [Dreissena polymorpha]
MTAVVFCGPVHTSPLNRVSQNSNSGLINISKSLLSQDKDAEDVVDKDDLNTQKLLLSKEYNCLVKGSTVSKSSDVGVCGRSMSGDCILADTNKGEN